MALSQGRLLTSPSDCYYQRALLAPEVFRVVPEVETTDSPPAALLLRVVWDARLGPEVSAEPGVSSGGVSTIAGTFFFLGFFARWTMGNSPRASLVKNGSSMMTQYEPTERV